jgi:DNA polymerase III gamma/tau subunit
MASMSEPLHQAYRPGEWDEVIGQRAIVTQLRRVLDKGSSRAFVFAGPSGVGKTTCARIAARSAGCTLGNVLEQDAAKNSGVDAMRRVTEVAAYLPMDGKKRAFVIDECHGLSKQAWDSLLKIVEESPKHALWFFCTTDARKLPATLKTRCTWFTFKLVPDGEILDLVRDIAKLEKIKIGDTVVDMIVKQARGSPRQALVDLAKLDGVTDRKIAAELLNTVLESDATIELCRFMFKPGSWMKAMAITSKLEGQSPEGVRIIVCRYFEAVLRGSTSDAKVAHALSILEAFCSPYNEAEGMAPLYLSLGRVMYP